MSSPAFVPGQRWVSNTESELGLGIVVDTTNRRVEISFPAAGERRAYAMENAPVSRVRYDVGQQVDTEDDSSITIEDVLEHNGCLIYSGVDEQGEKRIVPELDLNSFVQFSQPQDRLFAGQIDKNRAFQLRSQTLEHIRQQQLSPVRGLLGPRVQLLPHQLYIAHEVANRYAPRVLLADEVGLGKTIEAGMILHQQWLTGRARRVLVVVPDSLLHQWLVEMLRRFNLFFTILDEARCQALEMLQEDLDPAADDHSDNPFESSQLVLCTLSLLTDNPQRHQQAMAADWDLLIVDEAHHLQWSETGASDAYRAIEALSERARGLLLLTATPEQLGVASHFARLRLLDPHRYHDLQAFIEEERQHRPVNTLVQTLLADDAMAQLNAQPETLDQVRHYLGEAAGEALASAASDGDSAAFDEAVKRVVRQLLDRHGTGRVLFRNTRASVAGFPERQLHAHPLPAPAETTAATPLEARLAPETQWGEQWLEEDPRVAWLVDWLAQYRGEKVLVICARADTALALEEHLRLREGVASTVFHEGLSLVARDRAAAYFADDEDGAQVLICSEIGSEGRNFQFAHHLVLFDLPLNPDLLEQRIGRLDRIGQRHRVEIHVPFYRDSAQEVLLRWYHEGINAIERPCPAGPALFEAFREELEHCLLSPGDEQRLSELLARTQERAETLLAELQAGRDRLLELNSCNQQKAETIAAQMVEAECRQELMNYMEQVFDQFGVEQEHHSIASLVLRPGDHMLDHSFPGLPEGGVTATFSREVALSREDMQFLTWEHPMVTGAMDRVLHGDFGNTAFCTLKLPALKTGTMVVETLFVLQAVAPADLQLERYLPLSVLRVVVDSNGNDLSNILTTQHLQKLGQKVPRRSAQDLVSHARPQITDMIQHTESLAATRRREWIAEAAARMETEQGEELERMQALAQTNPNIRSEEIAFAREAAEQAQTYLQQAQLKLDAIRVVMVVD